MPWLIKTACNALLDSMTTMFGVLAGDFITVLGINIGADGFETINNSGSTLPTVLSNYASGSGAKDMFDAVFPMAGFKRLMVIMSLILLIALTTLEILRVFWAAPTKSNMQSPFTTVFKFLFVGILCVGSYRIMIIIEYICNSLYVAFGKKAVDLSTLGVDPKYSGVFSMADGATFPLASTFLTANPLEKIQSASTGGANPLVFKGVAGELMWAILCLVVTYLVIINFIKLLIEVIERYVVLGLLFYTCPMPFATLVSPSTSNIFASWIRMVFSHMLLIITSGMFINVFLAALIYVSTTPILSSVTQWLIYMFMLIGFLQVGQHFDEYLHGLGLSTAVTGGKLGRDLMMGIGTLTGAAMMGARVARGIGKATTAAGVAKAGKDVPGGGRAIPSGVKLDNLKQAHNLKPGETIGKSDQRRGGIMQDINKAAESGMITSKQAAAINQAIKNGADISKTEEGLKIAHADGSATHIGLNSKNGHITGLATQGKNGGFAKSGDMSYDNLASQRMPEMEAQVKSMYGIKGNTSTSKDGSISIASINDGTGSYVEASIKDANGNINKVQYRDPALMSGDMIDRSFSVNADGSLGQLGKVTDNSMMGMTVGTMSTNDDGLISGMYIANGRESSLTLEAVPNLNDWQNGEAQGIYRDPNTGDYYIQMENGSNLVRDMSQLDGASAGIFNVDGQQVGMYQIPEQYIKDSGMPLFGMDLNDSMNNAEFNNQYQNFLNEQGLGALESDIQSNQTGSQFAMTESEMQHIVGQYAESSGNTSIETFDDYYQQKEYADNQAVDRLFEAAGFDAPHAEMSAEFLEDKEAASEVVSEYLETTNMSIDDFNNLDDNAKWDILQKAYDYSQHVPNEPKWVDPRK